MSSLSVAVTALGCVTLYVGLCHLLLVIRSREVRVNLPFALTCFAIAAYDLFSAGLYSAATPAEGAVWQKCQLISVSVVGIYLLWFVSDFIGRKSRLWDFLFSVYWLVDIIFVFFNPRGWRLASGAAVKHVLLFGRVDVVYNEVAAGPLGFISGIVVLVTVIYVLVSLLRFYGSAGRQGLPVLVGLLCLLAGFLNDTAVALGLYDFVYTIEFAYAGLVLGMAYSLGDAHLKAEALLRESEERYRLLVEHAPDMVLTLDEAGRLCAVNAAGLGLLGRELADVVGRALVDFVHEDDKAAVRGPVESGRDGSSGRVFRLVRPDGDCVWVSLHSSVVRTENGRAVQEHGVARDITAEREATEELRRLAAAVREAAESIIVTDERGVILYVNPCFSRMTGYAREETLGKTPAILRSGKHDRAFYEEMWATVRAGRTWRGRFTNRRKDGTLFEEDAVISPVRDAAGTIVNYVAVKRDVTQELALEGELRQSQKMEAIGRLAGGVAHDFTNKLAVIMGNAQLVKRTVPPDSPEAEQLDEVLLAARQSGRLTSQLLAFAHKQPVSLSVVDLNRVIGDMEEMLQATLGRGVRLTLSSLAPELRVCVDPRLIEQSIVHLVVNTKDALSNGGQVTLGLDRVDFGAREVVQLQTAALGGPVAAGPFAVLSVSDNGVGMSKEVQSHVFEPFFTTKGTGRTTGLGLPTVYGIAKQHDGRVTVDSAPDQGTTFRMYLPLPAGETLAPDAPDAPDVSTVLDGKTVLVASADLVGRGVLVGMLQEAGCVVLESESTEQALALARDHDGPISALLTDLAYPGKDSDQLSTAVRAIRPDAIVLIASWHPRAHLMACGLVSQTTAIVSKPYVAARVRQALCDALAGCRTLATV